MTKTRVVVLGGGYAGVMAAQRLAGKVPSGTEIVLVSDRPHLVERIRLHERVAGAKPRRIPLARLLDSRASIAIGRVEGIDRRAGVVRTSDGAIPFDRALIALGSGTDWERVPGAAEHAFSPCDEDAAERLAAHLAGGERLPLLVIGGGLTAVETAAELAERGRAVTLITSGPVLPDHAPAGRAYALAVLRSLGVEIHERTRVVGIERDAVTLAGGRTIAGRAIWCGGFVPAPIAYESDLPPGPRGEVLVDATLRTADPRIWAAGDVARVAGMTHLRMACATAMPMGAHAADSIAADLRGERLPELRFGFLLQCLSLGRARGLVQTTDPFDRPLDFVVRGKPAAWIKERICRFTVHALRWEGRIAGLFWWPRPAHCIALPEKLSLR